MSRETETAKAQRQGRKFVVRQEPGRRSRWRLVAVGGQRTGRRFGGGSYTSKLSSKIIYQHTSRERVLNFAVAVLGADGFTVVEGRE